MSGYVLHVELYAGKDFTVRELPQRRHPRGGLAREEVAAEASAAAQHRRVGGHDGGEDGSGSCEAEAEVRRRRQQVHGRRGSERSDDLPSVS